MDKQILRITFMYLLLKGKGRMNTYWLVGKDGYTKALPKFSEDPDT